MLVVTERRLRHAKHHAALLLAHDLVGKPLHTLRRRGRRLRIMRYSSAGSSPSASRSGAPARICSAIRPEFWRIELSILAVISGLALRNALEFSRPWPRRWLS